MRDLAKCEFIKDVRNLLDTFENREQETTQTKMGMARAIAALAEQYSTAVESQDYPDTLKPHKSFVVQDYTTPDFTWLGKA